MHSSGSVPLFVDDMKLIGFYFTVKKWRSSGISTAFSSKTIAHAVR